MSCLEPISTLLIVLQTVTVVVPIVGHNTGEILSTLWDRNNTYETVKYFYQFDSGKQITSARKIGVSITSDCSINFCVIKVVLKYM